MGELKQGSDPHIRAIVGVRGEPVKAESEIADLWQPKWNENQTVLPQPCIPREGSGSLGRHSSWELDFRDCGAIPGRGLLLILERWIEGM